MTTDKDIKGGETEEQTAAPKSGAKRSATSRSRAASSSKATTAQGKGSRSAAKTTRAKAATGQTRRRTQASTQRPSKAASPEPATEAPSGQPRPLPRRLAMYRDEIAPALMGEFGYKSLMNVPRLSKIVLNIGMGEALENPKAMENAARDLSLIAAQHPVTTRARKSIAGFKVREGMAVGLSVTLHGRRMYEFFDRLVSSALPRIRDFRGVSRESFDGRGNFSLGLREHVIFPEIDYNTIDRIRGLQIVIVTTARADQEGLRFLELMGMPFARVEEATRVA